jgi:hypothetical protein
MIKRSHFFGSRQWLPSPIEVFSSKYVSRTESFKSVVIENMSKLGRIESKSGKLPLFLHPLQSWMRIAFFWADHFARFVFLPFPADFNLRSPFKSQMIVMASPPIAPPITFSVPYGLSASAFLLPRFSCWQPRHPPW